LIRRKLTERKKAIQRKLKTENRVKRERDRATVNEEAATNISDSTDEYKETESNEDEFSTDKPFIASTPPTTKRRKTVLSTKLAATLDRTNTSVRNATMIMASVINEAGDSSLSDSLLSKSTVHRCRQNIRKEASRQPNISLAFLYWVGISLHSTTALSSLN